ncbi:MAG: bifunctional riboflavin kinase/FAD synthetase [Epsilonproteobacteria bacterium]|nr:bifunctional riboflavin kinase/FAD synthetase [Campylobacterota bacterium]
MRSVTIGGFDGVHLAHRQLIKKADIVIVIDKGATLTPGFERLFYINKPIIYFELQKIKHKSAEWFIQYLKDLNISKIVIGEDFRFGKNKKGNIDTLKKHFEVEIIKEIKLNNTPIHSRIIRKLLNTDIKKANSLLGRHYKIRGTQIKGQGLGSKELVATINIELLKPYTLPHPGVYLTKTNSQNSLTFIGIRSSDNNFSIETHILNYKHIEKKIIEIEFIDFLRENKRLNLPALKRQIKEDILKANSLFQSLYK